MLSKIYNLIFSGKRSTRIKRHVIFWSFFYVYQVIRLSFLYPFNHLHDSVAPILISSLAIGFLQNVFLTYLVVYYLIPQFISKKKYFLFATGILVAFIIMFGWNILYIRINKIFIHAIGSTKQNPYIFLRGVIIRLVGNAPLVCALFVSLKALKNWHLRELENEQLTREKANAELQLLKAQIHPHFLFNTLNNIYSFALAKSPLAADLVQKLSDMLSYMITDCNRLTVPVEKEIQLIKDYIGLERVRYGERLDIQMYVNGDYQNSMIVPLLMIPFVENCFKHGASMMRGKQWMHLVISVNEYELDFNLSNSKPAQPNVIKNKNGIGLLNVQKRLDLLYPGRHELNINSTENTFSVYLKVALEKQFIPVTEKQTLLSHKEIIFKPNIHY
ncbi:MAG: sensor histidine kinase [Ginsengibacter sp.]